MEVLVAFDRIPEVIQASKEATNRALEAIGLQAENNARDKCPVDTGRLKSSITHEVVGGYKAVVIGTNVEYAKYVEFLDRLHHNVGQAHFLRDSVAKHTQEYKQIAEQYLKGYR